VKPRPHESPACRCAACVEYDGQQRETDVTTADTLSLAGDPFMAGSKNLDMWGFMLGVPRMPGETDDILRIRLHHILFPPSDR